MKTRALKSGCSLLIKLKQSIANLRDRFFADSEALYELDGDRRVRFAGYFVAFVMFGGFGLWATFAPLESAAIALGKVDVNGSSKAIQHQDGGIISEILVSNGDSVDRGQVVLRLDSIQLNAELQILQGRIWAQRALFDRLIAERDDTKIIVFSRELLYANDARAKLFMDSEVELFEVRQREKKGEIELLNRRSSALDEQIEGLEALLNSNEALILSLQEEIGELEQLLSEGYVDKQRIRELRRSLTQLIGENSDIEAKIAGVNISKGEVDLQAIQLLQRFKTSVVEELGEAQESLLDLEQRLSVVSDKLSRTEIISPISGVVLDLQPNTIGGVLAPRQRILSIVPDSEKLIVRAKISPMDIDRVRIGQDAEVRFSAFKDSYNISGVLQNISADSLIDEITGQPYFDATVVLMEDDMKLLGSSQLVPGMPAQVLIKTGSRTLLGYITSPMRRMFDVSLTED